MKYDIIVAGVGGQGSLSVSSIIASAAMSEGLSVKQSEVHGMSQRGGAVVTNLRLSDQAVDSDLIARGSASMILSMEPLEGLRYLEYLSPDGTLVSSTNPVVNIPDYPEMDTLLDTIEALPHSVVVDGEDIARRSGSIRATNMAMVGAASGLLPVKPDTIERFIRESFGRKGERVVEANIKAFRAGREAAKLVDKAKIERILNAAYERHDRVLLETDGVELLGALGFTTCASRFVRSAEEVRGADWSSLPGDKVVVKVVSPDILHKSDVGGVAIVPNEPAAIAASIEAMSIAIRGANLAGFTVSRFVAYDAALGGELLLGLRRTNDFGPVVTVGAGGVYSEFLAGNFKPGRDVAILSTELTGADAIGSILREAAVTGLVCNPPRGQKPRLHVDQLVAATKRLLWLGREFGHMITEFEINPLVIVDGELIALDVLVKLGRAPEVRDATRPVAKIRNLLEPRSVAVIGVSEKLNPGHVIVNNLLREGFDRERLYVVKPGTSSLEGCRCYSDIASLPERVDLLVVSVAAAQVPETVAEVIETRNAESIVVIPGGLEEKSGGELLASRMRDALAAARETEWRGPVINGGNCLGIRSRPGRYDTMFIPRHKLSTLQGSASTGRQSPVALISQSGAFGLASADRLAGINPKYTITLGNQMDLTVGDYLGYLKDDPEIDVFAVYVEGFAPLDGVKFLKAAGEIVSRGKTVVLYRAGRTPAGAKASSSHTASIAGDYAVTRALARRAGVVVAESVADFEDLTRLFTFLLGKKVAGRRLGAISNAGFECVAMADNLGTFTLPAFGEPTTQRLQAVFGRCRIDRVVDTHNPLDLTPMADDGAYEQVVLAVMQDENVDVGIVGCVPMSQALNTLGRGMDHAEDIGREDSVVERLVRLNDEITKPWVAVVDAGILYDAMAARLAAAGIPTFRTADRAMRLFDVFCEAKATGGAEPVTQTAMRQADRPSSHGALEQRTPAAPQSSAAEK